MRYMIILPVIMLANAAYAWNFIDVQVPAAQMQPVEFQRQFDILGIGGDKIGQSSSSQTVADDTLIFNQEHNEAEYSFQSTHSFMSGDVTTNDQWIFGKSETSLTGSEDQRQERTVNFTYSADGLLEQRDIINKRQGVESKFTSKITRDGLQRPKKELIFDEAGVVTSEKLYAYDEENGQARIDEMFFSAEGDIERSSEHYLYDAETKQIILDVLLASDVKKSDRSRVVQTGRCQQVQAATTLNCEKHFYEANANGKAKLVESRRESYSLVRTNIDPNASTTIKILNAMPIQTNVYVNQALVSREIFTYNSAYHKLTYTKDNGVRFVEKSQHFYDDAGNYQGEETYSWSDAGRHLVLSRKVVPRD